MSLIFGVAYNVPIYFFENIKCLKIIALVSHEKNTVIPLGRA